ncbi:hypothetical protein AnigIFM56816_005264 [Aspergillus niger]|nr:hypothetical protein AnigIFM56816_005264 [Aspergillus niger]
MTPYSMNDNGASRSDSAADAPAIERMATTDQLNLSVQGSDHAVDTEFLIVEAGPAGAALACFLSSHGLKGIMLSNAPATANSSGAHITNMAALGQ